MTIPGGVPPQLLSDWKAAEERLYPVVMVRPDLYERSVRLVRAVTDELAGCLDLRGAGARRGAARPRSSTGRRRKRASTSTELDAGLIAGAGVLHAVPGTGGRRLPSRAPGTGSGPRPRPARPGCGWRRSAPGRPPGWCPGRGWRCTCRPGAGLRQTLEADQMTGAPRYSLEVVPLDPATGDRLPGPGRRRGGRGGRSATRPNGWRRWRRSGPRSRAVTAERPAILPPIFRMVDGRVGK